jgi:hypothetical protein
MRITTRGLAQAALFLGCVLVLVLFLVGVAYGLGHGMVAVVSGLADDGSR